ncbi:MAG: phage tail tape measure protein [Dysgonamonadaceae bacterium]|jgi:TP901 family phage tail tape measure protein|nr:phage tail tape measure protein [Dysgonamonadaceae bacterium]
MAENRLTFQIDVNGNAYTGVVKIDGALNRLTADVKTSLGFFEKLGGSALKFNQLSDAASKLRDTIKGAIQPGIDFDYSLRELSAIAQVTGSDLDIIGSKARNLAKTFGGEAASYVESFKDVIGSLGDTFSDSTALDMMGANIATLSKLMGGDAKTAANALTTAMLQYGVDLKNPVEASREATRMMNVMQAAANVGGSEVADTAEALRQSGLLAKQSGVGFEELNASLEALAKGKIVAGEAGTAMRNIFLAMNTLGNAPKNVIKGLEAYGVNIKTVIDPSVKFTDRLREMQKIQNDPSLMESVFMKANIAAGQTILNNIDVIDEWTGQITGTNAAVEGAAIVMESYTERMSRITAKFEDFKISIFNTTGDLGIWTEVVASALVPVAQLVPLISGLGSAFAWLKGTQIASWFGDVITNTKILNLFLAEGQFVATGFGTKMLQAAVAVVRFATVGIWSAIKGVGALIASLVTGGFTSVGFSAISSAAFAAFATSARVACAAVSTAIHSIPIIGWIALAATAIGALFVWLYNKFDKFRAFMNGIGAAIKAIFTGGNVRKAFDNAYEETMNEAAKKRLEEKQDDPLEALKKQQEALEGNLTGGTVTPELNINKNLSNTTKTSAGDNKIKNINITIDKVVEKFWIETANIKESPEKIKKMVLDAIIESINDVNLAY